MQALLEKLKKRCEALYLPRGFHVWKHALEVECDAQYLRGIAEDYGITVNEEEIRAATWTHDPAYGLTPSHVMIRDTNTWRAAKYREEVHQYFAVRLMEEIGFPSSFIEKVANLIPATYVEGPLDTPGQKILAAADLRKVGFGETTRFIADTHKLHREAEMLKGESIPFPAFARGSVSYLGRFAARRNALTPRYHTEDGRSAWHMGALTNITRLAKGLWPELRVVVDLGNSLQPAAAHGNEPVHGENTLHVTICHGYKRRLQTLNQVAGHYNRLGAAAPMTVAIPDERGLLSISGGQVDELYVPIGTLWAEIMAGFPPAEYLRVLRAKGTLHLYDKHTPHLEHPPYKEVGDLSAVQNWLAPAGFKKQYDTDRPFGWEAVFSPN